MVSNIFLTNTASSYPSYYAKFSEAQLHRSYYMKTYYISALLVHLKSADVCSRPYCFGNKLYRDVQTVSILLNENVQSTGCVNLLLSRVKSPGYRLYTRNVVAMIIYLCSRSAKCTMIACTTSCHGIGQCHSM